jgi:hypothetical protein
MMASEHKNNVATYIGHFRAEHRKLLRLEDRLYRKLLVVTMLGALGEGRYPTVPGSKAKFIKLIETYSDWPDATSVSIPQLEMWIEKHGGDRSEAGLSEDFVEGLSHRYAQWDDRRNRGEIPRLGIDPKPEDILPKSPTRASSEKRESGSFHLS